MYLRIEAYDMMGAWRIHAVLLDQDQEDGSFTPVLDRCVDLHRLDSDETPEDILASVCSEANNLAYRR